MLLHQLLPFLSSSAGWGMLSKCKPWGEGYVVPVDLQELQGGSQSEDLMAAVEIQPLEGMASISAAIHEVRTCRMLASSDQLQLLSLILPVKAVTILSEAVPILLKHRKGSCEIALLHAGSAQA